MILRLALVLLALASALIGWTCRDRQYRLDAPYMESDQAVIAHDDSAYTSMTWVASPSGNYAQLRFFDKVEGGVCLKPSWKDLVALHDPRLAHLTPAAEPEIEPPQASWPYPWTPDPGTVSQSAYVRLFPLGLLMNNHLVEQAGGDVRAVHARALVVGLGSGTGLAVLAHHFPNLAISVVDIDRKVVAIVKNHYPLIRWLSEQTLPSGEPRLAFHVCDARQYIQGLGATQAAKFDLIILDAYTAGSTIPPHLMTKEFFADCARILDDHGIVLANVIGCYGRVENGEIVGEKHRVLGGAMRTFRAAGLPHLINFPVLMPREKPGSLQIALDQTRNNIVICSRDAIEPKGSDDPRWKRITDFTLYPEVPLNTYLTRSYYLARTSDIHWSTSKIDAAIIDTAAPEVAHALGTVDPSQSFRELSSQDSSLIEQVRKIVLAWAARERHGRIPTNWSETADYLVYDEYDCVAYARATYLNSVEVAHDVRQNGGEALVGDIEDADPHHAPESAIIADAPIFTDQRPNADILNR